MKKNNLIKIGVVTIALALGLANIGLSGVAMAEAVPANNEERILIADTPAPTELVKPDEETQCVSLLKFLDQYCNPVSSRNGEGITYMIKFVISLLTMGVVIAGTVGIIWSGFLILSARDNEQQVASARKRIIDIVIGLAIWGLGALIVNLIVPESGSRNVFDDLTSRNTNTAQIIAKETK